MVERWGADEASERHRRDKVAGLASDGVLKSQLAGVQQEPRCPGRHFHRGVQRVAHDRVADGGQVHTQLVGAAGVGLQRCLLYTSDAADD